MLQQFHVVRKLGTILDRWVSEFKHKLELKVSHLDPDHLRNLWTDNPHPKKRLRTRARVAIVADGRVAHRTRVSKVRYKPKNGELLAPGKYLRGVGDLTCNGSTKLGYFMDLVKEVFALPFHVADGCATFIKAPDRDALKDVFHQLLCPKGVVFYYFSDDSCISVECDDGTFTANVDISACDGSNYKPVFDVLKEAMSVGAQFQADVDGAFDQLELPCSVYSHMWTQKVKLVPNGPVLYSGSVLTTSVNNMANLLIFMCIMKLMTPVGNRRVGDMPRIIERAAEMAGYIVKVDICKTRGDIQFLKHSPCLVDGTIVPVLNLGVWLRGFGTFIGDLPGSSKVGYEERARMYNSDVIKSRCHAGNHILARSFDHLIVNRTLIKNLSLEHYNSVGGSDVFVPTEELCLRYGCTVPELEELCYFISISDVNDFVEHPLLSVMMAKDYGI